MKSSKRLKLFHLYATFVWGFAIPLTVLTNLKTSLTWIALMSVWANFVGHFSSWQAARAEVKVDNIDTEVLQAKEVKTDKIDTVVHKRKRHIDRQ